VAVDAGRCFESDPGQRSLVLVAHPERRLPAAQVGDVQRHLSGDPANGEIGLGLEVDVASAFRQAPREIDPGMVFHVEEVRAA
jgi:hypothetical protein